MIRDEHRGGGGTSRIARARLRDFLGRLGLPSAAVLSWLRYFLRTERFDRTLPGRWGRDGWMPHPLILVVSKQGLKSARSVSSRHAAAELRWIPWAHRADLPAKRFALELAVDSYRRADDRSVADELLDAVDGMIR